MARVAGNGLAPVTEGKERERVIIGGLPLQAGIARDGRPV
jgi:hypothetical protein